MELWRSRWILGVVLTTFALVSVVAGADDAHLYGRTEIDFMQDAKVIASQHEKKGKSDASHLTLSDGKVTDDASFQPIDERKARGPGRAEGEN